MVPNDGLDLLTITDFIGSHDRRHVEAAIRRRCHTVWIDPETTLCRILGRYKFFVDSRDIGLAPHLMLDGYWEFWISDFIWRNLRPGFRVLDVGANLGYYTVLAADLVGPQGQVTAFEPNPRMFELLQRNAGINGFSQWTDCSARAVSCRTGDRLDFSAAIADPKNGALVDAGSAALAAPGRLNITVETTTLDDACPSPVDFVKIDVEGAEEDLWAGMQQVIDRSPRIQILLEFNALRCRAPERMIESMASRFPLRRVGDDALVHACSAAELLAAKADTMLYLSHGIPLDYATPSAPDQG
ncbi:MAG: FkbM family methyltransferase [Paracraurococcus sp.]|jgi:FkbM family methyltransferase